MSFWETHHIEEKIIEVLTDVKYYNPEHHFGTPFLTAYQLAIELNRRYPAIALELGYKIGGKETGEQNSLSQYIAQQLSRRIKLGKTKHIEGAFLSNTNLEDIIFNNNGDNLTSSLTKSQYDVSMYRLVK